MAIRPIFVPKLSGDSLVSEINIEFDWHPGFSISQKRKSIESLHKEAVNIGYSPILEISTKSYQEIGTALSAFNLKVDFKNGLRATVEQMYQGSKVFEKGGPYLDFYEKSGKQIKKDERLKKSGNLVGFNFFGMTWELEPKTAFYDWIYLHALNQSHKLKSKILDYKSISDIEFNPKKSINCQARSAALFVSLHHRGILDLAIKGKESYLKLLADHKVNQVNSANLRGNKISSQKDLFE